MLYLVEDDDSIRDLVTYACNSQGLEARGFALPSAFWAAMDAGRPDLVVLDLMLPEEDGLQILKRLRGAAETARLPVLLLTARGSEYDKVLGLDSGADDYVTKPFSTLELLSRIRALLRRTEGREEESYRVGALYLCPGKHVVRCDGADVALTQKEFQVLCLLARDPGTVFSREQLLARVWGYDFDGETRTVDVHIRTLRQKLGPCGAYVRTVRGFGYKLSAEA